MKPVVKHIVSGLLFLSLVFFAGCGGGGGGGDGTTTTGGDTTLPSAPTGVTATAGDGQVTISWDAVSTATSYNLYMASASGVTKSNYGSLPDGTKRTNVSRPITQNGFTNGKTYYFVVTAVNANGESLESAEVPAIPSVSTLDVPSEYSTIQAAINAAGLDDVIKVAAGTYNENIEVKDKITIEGAGPGMTIIRGLGTDAVVSNSLLSGFTDGATITGVTIENGTEGIQLFSAIMTISNCVIINNAGDGIYLSSSPLTISNCRISSNSGDGINAFQSSVTVLYTIANSNAGDGINLYSSPANISYSTINSNTDGVYSYNSSGTIKNSIISNHSNSYREGIYEYSSSLTLLHLDFWNNTCNWEKDFTCYIGTAYFDAINSILSDPLFVSATDFHLQPGSPALTASDTGGQIGAYGNGGNPPD